MSHLSRFEASSEVCKTFQTRKERTSVLIYEALCTPEKGSKIRHVIHFYFQRISSLDFEQIHFSTRLEFIISPSFLKIITKIMTTSSTANLTQIT